MTVYEESTRRTHGIQSLMKSTLVNPQHCLLQFAVLSRLHIFIDLIIGEGAIGLGILVATFLVGFVVISWRGGDRVV